jgi:hypothetical protein
MLAWDCDSYNRTRLSQFLRLSQYYAGADRCYFVKHDQIRSIGTSVGCSSNLVISSAERRKEVRGLAHGWRQPGLGLRFGPYPNAGELGVRWLFYCWDGISDLPAASSQCRRAGLHPQVEVGTTLSRKTSASFRSVRYLNFQGFHHHLFFFTPFLSLLFIYYSSSPTCFDGQLPCPREMAGPGLSRTVIRARLHPRLETRPSGNPPRDAYFRPRYAAPRSENLARVMGDSRGKWVAFITISFLPSVFLLETTRPCLPAFTSFPCPLNQYNFY